jgi:hypothetical protein
MVDTNLWDNTSGGVVGFSPRIIFPNGAMMGPSVFPVRMELVTRGHLPKESLFFKSIATDSFKRSDRRRIFRNRKGPKLPGLLGIVSLALFGKVPEGYESFGFEESESGRDKRQEISATIGVGT